MIRSLQPQALRPWVCRASRRIGACGRIASRVDPAPTLRATQRYLGSVRLASVRQASRVPRRQAHHSAVIDVDTVIRGGTVVTTSGVSRADVAISNGKIVGLWAPSTDTTSSGIEEIDATGLLVLPGGVDSHCHIAQPSSSGGKMAGDWTTATRAAAVGGTTTVLAFSTQDKGGAGVTPMVEAYLAEAAAASCIDYSIHMIVSDPTESVLRDELPALIASGLRSVKIFMTYPKNRVGDAEILKILECVKQNNALLCVHAENHDAIVHLTAALLAAGKVDTKYHAWCKPPEIEREAVHRIITLAEILDQPIQIFHVTCAAAADEVTRAQARGVKVFAETCPHYLVFTADNLDAPSEIGAQFLCSPALRSKEDHSALWQHLRSGTIGNVTSDHAPYNLHGDDGKFWAGKDADFSTIANGMAGIQTRMTVLFSEGVSKKRLSLEDFVALTSTNAAKLFGLYPEKGAIAVGADADIVLWDADREETITHSMICDGVDHTPWEGLDVVGWPVLTLSRGKVVARDGAPHLATPGWGKFLARDTYSYINPAERR